MTISGYYRCNIVEIRKLGVYLKDLRASFAFFDPGIMHVLLLNLTAVFP